jgi:hypothetical protein
MSFLQPLLLFALPLAALPIIIHLINQRRYQTVRWAAMMFLLAANRMSRGYARLRQWLIMAVRMAAIAGLVFAVSRPLAGGWLGLAGGGRADTTIVLVDRSPSMQQTEGGTGGSKLETGVRQLASALGTLGSARWVLLADRRAKPRELDTPAALPAAVAPTSAAADIPGMLDAARDYMRSNKTGRTEVWICSDLRSNDWGADGGRWPALRDAFLEFQQGARFHLLAYPRTAPGNISVRVTETRRRKTGNGAELAVSLVLAREGNADSRISVPVQFEIEGARSEVTVEMASARYELKGHRIPLERGRTRGWGKVSIPADANLGDNDWYFGFDVPAPRRAIIVAEENARLLELAAAIAPDPEVTCSAEVVAPDALSTVGWEDVALLLWQAPLPEAEAATRVRAFVDRGGQAIFLPPRAPTATESFGAKWTAWNRSASNVESWRGDQDLLAHTQSGAPLPVGQLQARKSCGMAGDLTPLATLRGGAPLLARAATNRGGAYFLATTPAPGDSSLATDGVVLYVLIQRALAAGAVELDNVRSLDAGALPPDDPAAWKRLAGPAEAVSTDYSLHRGVYTSGRRLYAVNRPATEDGATVLDDRRVAALFRGLDFDRVDDRAGSLSAIVQEVWRMFLAAMLLALVAEAWLCLPRRARPAQGATP